MPLSMGRVLSMEHDRSTSSATEYRERYMSPRREDYTSPIVLPKINSTRSSSDHSFLSSDFNPNATLNSSEYRLCFANHHPKRPYVFHAKPSHVFDYVPMPLESKSSSRLSTISSVLKDTEYKERYPNYRSSIPIQELLPPHLSSKSDIQSNTQEKKDRMTRSQYFYQLIKDNEKLNGGQRSVGTSEQRTAFQWPYHLSQPQQKPQQQEIPTPVYPPYHTPKDIYEPLPPLQRAIVNTSY